MAKTIRITPASGSIQFEDDNSIASITTSGSVLTVSGSTNFKNGIIVTGSMVSTAPASFSGSLSVTGSLGVTGTSTAAGLTTAYQFNTLYNGDSYKVTNTPVLDYGDGLRILYAGGSHKITMYTNSGTPRLQIVNNGNIQIGTTTDTGAKFTIQGSGTTSSTTALLVQNANASASFQVKDNSEVVFATPDYTPNDAGNPFAYLSKTRTGIYIANTANNFGISYEGGQIYANIGYSTGNPTLTPSNGVWTTNSRINATSLRGTNGIFVSGLDKFVAAEGGTDLNIVLGGSTSVSGQGRIIAYGETHSPKRGKLELYSGTDPVYGVISFSPGNTETARFTPDGNFNIGTITGSAKLLISGSSNSVLFEIDSPAVNNILFVSGSGRVGIGTNTPAYPLDVRSSTQNTTLSIQNAGNPGQGNSTAALVFGNADSYTSTFTLSNGGITLNTHGNSSPFNVIGSLAVGSISGAKLAVKGSGTTSSSTSLLVQNANSSGSLVIRDGTTLGGNNNSSNIKVLTDVNDFYGNYVYPNLTGRLYSLGVGGNLVIGAAGAQSYSSSFLDFNVGYFDNGQGQQQPRAGFITATGTKPHGEALDGRLILGTYRYQYGNAITQSSTVFVYSGSVGIGISTPTYTLDVSGSSRFTGELLMSGSTQNRSTKITNSGLYLSRTSDGGYPSSITADGTMYYGTRNDHVFQCDGSTLLSISQGNQNVTIGTGAVSGGRLVIRGSGATSSTTSLLVQNSSATELFKIADDGVSTFGNAVVMSNSGDRGKLTWGGGNFVVAALGGQSLALNVDSTNVLYVQTGTKNVGIGTSSPAYTLDVSGSARFTDTIYTNFAAATATTAVLARGFSDGNFQLVTQNGASVSGYGISTTFGMIYSGSGDVAKINFHRGTGAGTGHISISSPLKIGDTSTTAPASQFTVKGSGATSSTTSLLIQNSSTTTLLQVKDDGEVTVPSLSTTGPVVSTSGVLSSVAGYSGMVTIQQTPMPPITLDIQNGIIVNVF